MSEQKQAFEPGQYSINPDIKTENKTDSNGNPTGAQATLIIGELNGPRRHVLAITWQDGPRKKTVDSVDGKRTERLGDPNGAFVEDVLYVAYQRLAFFQDSKFKCPENAEAMAGIESALIALDKRRQDRATRGVEGQHEV